MVNMIIKCDVQGCLWASTDQDTRLSISDYLAHTIRRHWWILQYAHDNPDALARAIDIVKGN